MTHRKAVLAMIAATLMWSIAGVVSRHLDSARSFEVTFWRSAFNALALLLMLAWLRGPAVLWAAVCSGGRSLWLSGLCWCVMYTAFMLALTLTTVANVLVTMALAPLFTALLSRLVLKHRLAARTWGAIVVAGLGIAWMYGSEVSAAGSQHVLGTLVALAVPVAAATNWTLLQRLARTARPSPTASGPSGPSVALADDVATPGAPPDMLVAVLLGALLSCALTLPLSLPFGASGTDVAWLGMLGVVQLAVPCLMAVVAARSLSAPEASLFSLLEVVFGVAWAWLGAGEAPGTAVLGGGLLVLAALAANEALALRGSGSRG